VITLCEEGLKKYPQDPLAPKFQLLHSFAVARTSDERSFKEDLKILIKNWPGTTESKKAEEMIAFLNQKTPELKVEEEKTKAAELYVADKKVNHVFILIIYDPSFNKNQATFDVISYNIDNFTNKNYKTEGVLVEKKYIMITVSGFSDFAQTLDYYNSFITEKNVRNPSGAKMMTFIINNANLKVLNNDKNPEPISAFLH